MIARIVHAGLCLVMLNGIAYSNIRNEMTHSLEWIKQIQKVVSTRTTLSEADTAGKPVILEYELICGKSARLNEIIKKESHLLVQEYTRMELEFARKNPGEIESQMFLKSLAPLFKDGVSIVDWGRARSELHDNLSSFFNNTDFAQYCSENELSLFVIAKEHGASAPFGVIQFLVKPEFEYGTVKAAFFAVADGAKNRGIEKILMHSIVQLVPEVTRIFLHTRNTNTTALDMYTSWGFTQFDEAGFWVNMEYNPCR